MLPRLIFHLQIKDEQQVLKVINCLRNLSKNNESNEIGALSKKSLEKFIVLQVPIVNYDIILDIICYGHLVF